MKSLRFLSIALLLFATTVFAQQPAVGPFQRLAADVTIDVPVVAQYGEVVPLRTSEQEAAWAIIPGNGHIVVVLATVDANGKPVITSQRIALLEGPDPLPPDPTPLPPDPDPEPVAKLWVIVVGERKDRHKLSIPQIETLVSAEWRKWLVENGHPGARLFDPQDVDENADPVAAGWIKRAGDRHRVFLAARDTDSKVVILDEGPVPEGNDAMLEWIKKHGAKK